MLYSAPTLADRKWDRLAEFVSSPKFQYGRRIFVLDFDGTTAPIVDLPSQAAPDPVMKIVFNRLVAKSSLAILSGRPVDFLRHRLAFLSDAVKPNDVLLFGHYGLERTTIGSVDSQVARIIPEELEELSDLKQRWLANPVPEIYFEDKGYSCAFHFRNSVEYKEQLFDWIDKNLEQRGLVARLGKMVVEVVPSSSPTKVSIIREFAKQYDSVVFAGDDLGDLDSFIELERERDLGLSRFSILVEGGFETPPELLVSCDLKVESPMKLALVLDRMVNRLPKEASELS